MTRVALILFFLVSPWLPTPKARASITYFPERKVWVLQAGEATYACRRERTGRAAGHLLGAAGAA